MRWLPTLALILMAPLAGCATTQPGSYIVEPNGPYTLDTGDLVRVTVYGDQELSNTYRVGDSGTIAFPLVGQIQVRGQTTTVAASRLAAALANGYLRNPNVAIEVAEYRPFFIQGAVKTSGQFTYVPYMTARAAISTAGGYADTADRSKVTVYRRTGNEMVQGSVNLDFPIYPGDTVVVPERWF
jgi:polysaccharide export outer membrane protein